MLPRTTLNVGFSCRVVAFVCTLLFAVSGHAAVTISSAATNNMSCASGVCTPTAKDAVLNAGDLETMLASSSVTVNTAGATASDIDVKGAVTWTSANGLTLDAYQSIAIGKPVVDNGTASLTLLTDDGGSGGALSFGTNGRVSFSGTSNVLSINGNTYTLVNKIASLSSDIMNNPAGFYALAGNYNASKDGTYSQSPVWTTFEGIFEGLGNTISNLSISSSEEYVGLFADIDTLATVRDVRLTNIVIAGSAYEVGGLVSELFGATYGDSVSGIVTSAARNGEIGGLIAAAAENSKIVDCTSSATVEFRQRKAIAGGLVGNFNGTLSDSSATGDVSIGAASRGTVSGVAGGLVGFSSGAINESFATGKVSGKKLSRLGGLVGFTENEPNATVANSYATGAVSGGENARVGGLVGWNDFEPNQGITDSYSTGAPTGGAESSVGGLIGYDQNTGGCGCFTDLYWDMTKSGITNVSQGAGNVANDPGITGETTKKLRSGLPAGFDPAVWAEKPGFNHGLPYLIANPPAK